MAKKKITTKIDSFEKEYSKLMEGFKGIPMLNQSQVVSPADMFVKFSLYTQNPLSTTSTNTSQQNA